MSDLISRADAIEAVERIGSLDTDADREYARSIIDALPSAEAEWIPCSERLPSERGWYLITVKGTNCFTDMDYYYGNSEWDEVSSKQKVIAWMPRPKPYREDGEE